MVMASLQACSLDLRYLRRPYEPDSAFFRTSTTVTHSLAERVVAWPSNLALLLAFVHSLIQDIRCRNEKRECENDRPEPEGSFNERVRML